jgi:hypothetical protein
MRDILEHAGPWVAIAAMVINFVWSSMNLRLMRSMEGRFITKVEFHGEQRVQSIRHAELVRRLEKVGA